MCGSLSSPLPVLFDDPVMRTSSAATSLVGHRNELIPPNGRLTAPSWLLDDKVPKSYFPIL